MSEAYRLKYRFSWHQETMYFVESTKKFVKFFISTRILKVHIPFLGPVVPFKAQSLVKPKVILAFKVNFIPMSAINHYILAYYMNGFHTRDHGQWAILEM